jgi:hypothetical protein
LHMSSAEGDSHFYPTRGGEVEKNNTRPAMVVKSPMEGDSHFYPNKSKNWHAASKRSHE